nr:MFS transporter [Sphingomonas daechungensis]
MEPVHGGLRRCPKLHAVGRRTHGRCGGEAGGIAPSYSLISDYFPRERRSRALAFYSLGIPIGSALGVFFGGWLAAQLSWRSAFIIVGLLGLPAALLIKLLVPEPERGRFDAAPAVPMPAAEVLRTLVRIPASGCCPSVRRPARSLATA